MESRILAMPRARMVQRNAIMAAFGHVRLITMAAWYGQRCRLVRMVHIVMPKPIHAKHLEMARNHAMMRVLRARKNAEATVSGRVRKMTRAVLNGLQTMPAKAELIASRAHILAWKVSLLILSVKINVLRMRKSVKTTAFGDVKKTGMAVLIGRKRKPVLGIRSVIPALILAVQAVNPGLNARTNALRMRRNVRMAISGHARKMNLAASIGLKVRSVLMERAAIQAQ